MTKLTKAQHKLQQNFKEIAKQLKNCLEDDWVAEIRYAAVILMRKMMEFLRDEIDYEDLKEIYPDLLKRLDDAQDGIRIEAAKNFELFFELVSNPWSSSLYEYTVKNIYIHLDDPN